VSDEATPSPPHRRRPRYSGKNPRRFAEKYKERNAAEHPETVAKVIAAGKTPAGTHRPIMVREILEILQPHPREVAVDCTLGYGGHAAEILPLLQPGGKLIGLDVDPIELPKTEARLRLLGFGLAALQVHRTNYAGISRVLAAEGLQGANLILADLGLSSMQIDDPVRGFSVKVEGPLDMRMNPQRGQPAAELLRTLDAASLAALLRDNSDEPQADLLAPALAGQSFQTTSELRKTIDRVLSRRPAEEIELSARRVFQALRIAVNDEFSALDAFLRQVPDCLLPGGRLAILSFHSGEDRRVKKALAEGLRTGLYEAIAPEVIRPTAAERHQNLRAGPAKLRWAKRAATE